MFVALFKHLVCTKPRTVLLWKTPARPLVTTRGRVTHKVWWQLLKDAAEIPQLKKIVNPLFSGKGVQLQEEHRTCHVQTRNENKMGLCSSGALSCWVGQFKTEFLTSVLPALVLSPCPGLLEPLGALEELWGHPGPSSSPHWTIPALKLLSAQSVVSDTGKCS